MSTIYVYHVHVSVQVTVLEMSAEGMLPKRDVARWDGICECGDRIMNHEHLAELRRAVCCRLPNGPDPDTVTIENLSFLGER